MPARSRATASPTTSRARTSSGRRRGRAGHRHRRARTAAATTGRAAAMATEAVPRQQSRGAGLPWLAARVLGALALLAVGIIHLQQYVETYSEIPTIGPLFVL